jgi:hypothetical protein
LIKVSRAGTNPHGSDVSGEEYERIVSQMATRRNYRDERASFAPWFMVGMLLAIIALGIGLVRFRPDLILGTAANNAANDAAKAQPTLRPTSTGDQIKDDQKDVGQTDADRQALDQSLPKDDLSKPPMLPVEATAAAVTQPAALDAVPAQSLSPVDLTYRPVPTPTTMLTQEQFDASQASEEQNFINGQLQGLTPAQQMVQVHEAEGNAQP